jgi:hypothetical protein
MWMESSPFLVCPLIVLSLRKSSTSHIHIKSGFQSGPQKIVIDEVLSKKFLCSRQGFKKTNIPPTRKQKNHTETRCGCNAHVFVKLGVDKWYCIASVVEEHNHIIVSPDKTQFL